MERPNSKAIQQHMLDFNAPYKYVDNFIFEKIKKTFFATHEQDSVETIDCEERTNAEYPHYNGSVTKFKSGDLFGIDITILFVNGMPVGVYRMYIKTKNMDRVFVTPMIPDDNDPRD